MRFSGYFVLLFLLSIINVNLSADTANITIADDMPILPNSGLGLGGCFVGVHNNVVLVAGGTNFPQEMPWNEGSKVWYDDIYILEKKADGGYKWSQSRCKLPQKMAYGASVSLAEGVLCIGGLDEQSALDTVFLLRWNPAARDIEIEKYPSLPQPVAYISAAVKNGIVYAAGGIGKYDKPQSLHDFYSLNISEPDANWHSLPSWPGMPRSLAVLAAQSNGTTDCIYLFGGFCNEKEIFLKDGYCYEIKMGKWHRVEDMPSETSGAAYLSYGGDILVFGGNDGIDALKRIALNKRIEELDAGDEKLRLQEDYRQMFEHHPGFSSHILGYNAIVDKWRDLGEYKPFPVTTAAVRWNGRIVIPTGEIRPGVRSDEVISVEIKNKGDFGFLNWLVLAGYLFTLLFIGVYFSRRVKTSEHFFLGGRSIPWWAAGLSIFGAQLSAITFMAIPAKTFAADWLYFPLVIGAIIMTPVIIKCFIPFYRRLNVTSAYEYLELRFGLTARLIGTATFTVMHVGRLAIVILLPSLAMYAASGMNVFACIMIMGTLATLYTMLGGIEAVIWADVVQVIILLASAVICFIVIVSNVDGGAIAVFSIGMESQKFNLINWDFDLTKVTFIVLILNFMSGIGGPYATDQSVVQRYLTTKDEKTAAKALWTNILLSIPASILFYSLGTALYVFYKANPSRMIVDSSGTDAILPMFIINQLPAGISGLAIAGIFAASMSSLDSSMNSVATVLTTDFYKRLFRDSSEHKCVIVAKIITVVIGLTGTFCALLMATADIKSLWDQFTIIVNLFGAGLGGLFVLGIFTKQANIYGAVSGFIFSAIVQYCVSRYTDLHFFLYSVTGLASCIIVGLLVSLCTTQSRNLDGLTIYTQKLNNHNEL